jgi:UDP-N-acetylmuramoyl-tripeptide--D-alanyl-D-alanine ligase
VRKSDKSFNSEIGIPLTILGCPNGWNNPLRWLQNIFDGFLLLVLPSHYPQWLVLEVGADRPGDIKGLASWLPVDIAVITRLPEMPVHVEFFDSPEAVVEEKASIIEALKPSGSLVLYADDIRTMGLKDRAVAKHIAVHTFGLSPHAEVRGSDYKLLYTEGAHREPVGMHMQISQGQETALFNAKGVVGAHTLLSVLGAVAVGNVLGKNLTDMIGALEHYEPPHGRMHLLRGIKQTVIIDDTYNSSPAAVVAALDTLELFSKESPGVRRVAVLADMLELGRHSVDEHRKIGIHASKTVDVLLTVGFRARDIAEAALDQGFSDGAIFQYEDAPKAGEELAAMLQPGDIVLVKGSQSMRMERVVENILAEPERAGEFLVRQDRDWKMR